GVIAQRHFLDQRTTRAVEDVERAVGLVADIDPRPIRRGHDSVRGLDPFDLLDDLVGRGINDVNAVAGAVSHIDESRTAPRRQRDECQDHPQMPQDPTMANHGNLPACAGRGYAQPSAYIKASPLPWDLSRAHML